MIKMILISTLFFMASHALSNELIDDLKNLEKKYNIDLSTIIYKKKENPESAIKILEDKDGFLRNTKEKNFFLNSENKSIELFKQQMSSSGGSRVGNGGDVLLCDNKVEVLDSFRARHYNQNALKISSTASLESIVFKLKRTIPSLGKSLEYFINNFKNRKSFSDHTFWSPEKELININDEELMTTLPRECSLIQAVVRFTTKRKIFFYNQEVFEMMEDEQLSWILVHEWLWDYLHSSSDIRDVNHFLHSLSFEDSSEEEIMSYLNQLGFSINDSDLFTEIEDRKKTSLESIESFITKIQDIESDLQAHQLMYDHTMLNNIVYSSDIEDRIDFMLKQIHLYVKRRLAMNVGELERYLLMQWEKHILNESFTTYDKIEFIKSESSIYRVKARTKVGLIKIHIQKKYWYIIPANKNKAVDKMNELDRQFNRNELTIQEYTLQVFKAFKLKVPQHLKDL
ncbi:hypothetical protein HBN50_12865 [Halobacteriovorax sp. GB3]|uniref:hypothetical protein n=1 Tax=Halobacteriovorax sp. GB3 TaxID=2719615 RepID=UPI002362819F|nr:hypothetical protein [Halobacteriovorax sp. GB3]MDD0853996.1 hypothetical protein [Halobacteriovorax sp. GB3]